ncbi:RrF2 family transcriptional regulator [Wenzhouxiangella marina]|uniref:HTH-type transcriptional regulator NsrR n=1 Tax=Wenzhouxiangella marina TaxID=1579979 RepID=A0A0K0XTU9_9GAMM|nr:Rrf2 family transcriptional regulator [Wenzhouxiangella marina]AKS41139.1 HTH-type transcriptional regulator NsrR [Wenzhouxiangella marina]MBB6088018.1 Rrf2 family nitric oxide-sensitive transcriptional repressor [Wenzhouxiangella marina]
MRLTQFTDYSLRVLIYLALNPERRCRIRDIASAYGVSHNHLMKVVQKLVASGYVDTVRGAGGGLMLRKSPDKINLAELVEAMEPDFGLVECLRPDNQCIITGPCRLPGLLRRATEAFLDVLRTQSLADFLAEPERKRMTEALRAGAGTIDLKLQVD